MSLGVWPKESRHCKMKGSNEDGTSQQYSKGKGHTRPPPPPKGKGSDVLLPTINKSQSKQSGEPFRRETEISLVQAILNRKPVILKKLQAKARVFKDKNINLDDVIDYIQKVRSAQGRTIEEVGMEEKRKKLKKIGAALSRIFYSMTAHLCEPIVFAQFALILEKVHTLLRENREWFDVSGSAEPKVDTDKALWLQDNVYPIYRGDEKVDSLTTVLKVYKEERKTYGAEEEWEKTVSDYLLYVVTSQYGQLLSASQDKKPLKLHVKTFEPRLHTLKCETTINDRMMPSWKEFETALEICLEKYVSEEAKKIDQLITQAEFHFTRKVAGSTGKKSETVGKVNVANKIVKSLGGNEEQKVNVLLIKLTKLQAAKYRIDPERKLGFYSALLGLARFLKCCFLKSGGREEQGQYFRENLGRLEDAEARVKTNYGCVQHFPIYLKRGPDVYNENYFEFLKDLLNIMILEYYKLLHGEAKDNFNRQIKNVKKAENEDPPSTYWKLSTFLKATLLHKEGIQLAIDTLVQGYEGAAMLDRLLSQLATDKFANKGEGVPLYKQAFERIDLIDKLFLALTVAEEFLTMLYRGDPSPRCASESLDVAGACVDSPSICASTQEVLPGLSSGPETSTFLDEDCKSKLCPERGDCPNLEKNYRQWARKLHPDKNNKSLTATSDFQHLNECVTKFRKKLRLPPHSTAEHVTTSMKNLSHVATSHDIHPQENKQRISSGDASSETTLREVGASKEDPPNFLVTAPLLPKTSTLPDEECEKKLCPEKRDCPNLERNYKEWARKLYHDKNRDSSKAVSDALKLKECKTKIQEKLSLSPPSASSPAQKTGLRAGAVSALRGFSSFFQPRSGSETARSHTQGV